MLVSIPVDCLKMGHRYFITDGTHYYFGTYFGFSNDCIKLHGKKVPSVHGCNVMYFDTTRYFKYTCYTFVPCKMEQVLLNKILQKLTGDSSFSYSLGTPFTL